jgi:L-ribulose-5-phosphate 4-epimerase
MFDRLKEEVLKANLELPAKGMVTYTWGNVSGIDRTSGIIAIKPSGVAPTHVALYNAFPEIGGVCHTHSHWATSWAQTGLGLPAYGTTHADYFYGEIPCTRDMGNEEIQSSYEENTGLIIIETFRSINPMYVPGVLVRSHAPFTWGKNAEEAVHNSVVLEQVAMIAIQAKALNPLIKPMPQALLDKHFLRKHGANAYYGQK